MAPGTLGPRCHCPPAAEEVFWPSHLAPSGGEKKKPERRMIYAAAGSRLGKE